MTVPQGFHFRGKDPERRSPTVDNIPALKKVRERVTG